MRQGFEYGPDAGVQTPAGGDVQAPSRAAPHTIVVAGTDFVADVTGALYWPAERMLVVADLHLEKGSAFAQRGRLLPPYDTRETLLRLDAAVARFAPRTIVALGDSLHDRGAASRIDAHDRAVLARLQSRRDWVWVTGNHDPSIDRALGGSVAGDVRLGQLVLRHEPSGGAADGEIAGHLHPAARLVHRGCVLRRPCYVSDGRRLVLPAFGAFTGGLNVLDAAFGVLMQRTGLSIWMLGRDDVYRVAPRQLTPD